VYPEAVNGNENETSEADPMMVDYSKLTPALVDAIQQQQVMIEKLKASNDNLEKRIAQLEELLLKASADENVNGK
jgi:phage shock protein A